jgi:hypothetical protein
VATPKQMRRRGRFALITTVLVGALLMTGVALGYVSTDQPDYSPGSVVTITGDNSNGAGYVAGNSVAVDVSGPNGWTGSCSATVGGGGTWSCQVTLSSDASIAVGAYTYTATSNAADGSTISESGTFTDTLHVTNATPATYAYSSGCTTTAASSFTSGDTVCTKTVVTSNGSGGADTFYVVWFKPDNSIAFADSHSAATTTYSDSHLVTDVGTWKVEACDANTCNTSNGNKTYGSATFTVASAITNHDPVLTLPSGLTAEATSPSGANVTFTGISATDQEDGDLTASVSCSPSSGSLFAIGTTQVDCSVADSGGLSDSGSFDVTVQDTTAPDSGSISINNGAVWTNTTAVTVDLSAHDAVGVTGYRLAETSGGLDSASTVPVTSAVNFDASDVPFTLSSGDSTAKSVYVRFYDAAGNSSDTSDTIGLDTVKPLITGDTGSYTPGTWTSQSVTVSFTCADDQGTANSGIASNNVAGTTLTTSGADQSFTNTGSCTDYAGNTADAVTIGDIDIDKVSPTVTCNAASFTLNQPGAEVSAAVTDFLSGPLNATESASADTSSVGLKHVSITGYDVAGNSTTVSCAYTVGYNFDGLYAPVNRPNTLNVSKAGQAIPLKWMLTDWYGLPVTTLSAVTVKATGIACDLGSTTDQIEEYAAGSSGLQNLGGGYYQYNWKTPTSYAKSCKTIGLDLDEGFTRSGLALFSFAK